MEALDLLILARVFAEKESAYAEWKDRMGRSNAVPLSSSYHENEG